jgi:Large polyvalent protein-associated domain 7
MTDKQAQVLGTIEPAGERQARPSEGRTAVPPTAPPIAQRVPGAGVLDVDFERRHALRLQLEQAYSVHNGVYADPARPTVPLFVAESRKIVAYDTREPTIRAMLDLAQANRWNAIKVTGDKEFQRRVWIEARARGMEATLHSNKLLQRAYQPCPDDFKIVAKLKEARGLGNRIEPTQTLRAGTTPREAPGAGLADGCPGTDAPSRPRRETARQRHERYRTAIAAVDGYLATKGVAENVREAIRNLAQLELIARDAAGRPPRAAVVDPSVPSRVTPAPERSLEVDREPAMGR